jgi:hypothetical protein
MSNVCGSIFTMIRDMYILSTPPPVELQKYHESAVDSEDNVPCTRNRVAHETKVY